MKKGRFQGTRIEVYYTVSILVIILLLAGSFYLVAKDYVIDAQIENLKETTEGSLQYIHLEGERLEVDQDVTYSSDGAFVVLTDSQGRILDGDLGHTFLDRAPFKEGTVHLVRDEGERYYIYDLAVKDSSGKEAPEGQKAAYWLRGVTSAEFSEMAPSLAGSMRTMYALIPVLLLVILLAGWLVTRRALAPLRKITKTAELIQKEGDLSRRIGIQPKGRTDEIRHTAEVFDSMLEQIEKDFEREKRFSDDAGHELRTPVAVMMAECEYALSNKEAPEEVEASLRNILAECRHMTELINTLILFARADRNRYELNCEPIDLGLLAEECCGRSGAAAEEKGIRLSVQAEGEFYTEGDRLLVGRALENLIANGIKYGRAGGFVRVKVEKTGETAVITVEDDGIGVPAEEREKIWERFYRAENARRYTDPDGEDESMGLGLALVRWICAMHGGEVQLVEKEGPGSRFVMKLPLMPV